MFDVCDINFANGCIGKNGLINGVEAMIMTEMETAEQYIREFRHRYWPSADPNEIIAEINEDFAINEESLMQSTVDYINKEITKIVRGYR